MNIVVARSPSVGGATVGRVTIDGVFACYSLEDEVREIPGVPVSEWKIFGQTAIPAGKYRVTLENSPRFGVDTLTINDVPGFTGVRMHAGNWAKDTEGCLLLGMQATEASLVGGTSGPAVAMMKAAVKQAIAEGDLVWIEIQPPEAVA